MKRFLLVAAIAAALVIPTVAFASATPFTGTVTPSGTMGFTLKKHNGHLKVTNFNFATVPMHCDQGDKTTSGNTGTDVFPVVNNKFSAKLSNGNGGTLKFAGKLNSHHTKATGTLRAFGTVAIDPYPMSGNGTNCDTGTDAWTAHK